MTKSRRCFVNVGAGGFRHLDWVNVDKNCKFYIEMQSNETIHWDLLDLSPMPFPDNSIDLIYSSHVIEHISDEAAMHFFREALRALRDSGGLHITCPDIKKHFALYQRGQLQENIHDYGEEDQITRSEYYELPRIDASQPQRFLWAFARQASIHHNQATNPLTDEEVDYLFANGLLTEALDLCVQRCSLVVQQRRPEEHINWWTHGKLARFLMEAGFPMILESHAGQSLFPEMRDRHHFDRNAPDTSLFMEAVKKRVSLSHLKEEYDQNMKHIT